MSATEEIAPSVVVDGRTAFDTHAFKVHHLAGLASNAFQSTRDSDVRMFLSITT